MGRQPVAYLADAGYAKNHRVSNQRRHLCTLSERRSLQARSVRSPIGNSAEIDRRRRPRSDTRDRCTTRSLATCDWNRYSHLQRRHNDAVFPGSVSDSSGHGSHLWRASPKLDVRLRHTEDGDRCDAARWYFVVNIDRKNWITRCLHHVPVRRPRRQFMGNVTFARDAHYIVANVAHL